MDKLKPYQCPYCDHYRTWERLQLAQGELTALQTQLSECQRELEENKKLLLEILTTDMLIPVDLAYRISKVVGLNKKATKEG